MLKRGCFVVAAIAAVAAGSAGVQAAEKSVGEVPAELKEAFTVPAEFAGQLGAYKSPLKFYDGRAVRTKEEWAERRAEILKYWHGRMGAWPELLARPKVVREDKREREGGIVEERLQIEIAPGEMLLAYLLVPPETFAAQRPAVLVPFYAPEVSVAYDGPRALEGQAKRMLTTGERGAGRDFGLALAKRGFVTLSIGTPGDDARRPAMTAAVTCQPLSYYAYIAANCHTLLAQRAEVDGARVGVMGHSYGGKWAMFATCLYEKFATGVWSDGGVVFDETKSAVNYWEPWYLGRDMTPGAVERKPGVLTATNGRTGPYKAIFESGHDLHELHALMAPRPFLVSGGSEDPPARWVPLNHAIAVNRFLGYENRVAMTNRPKHSPTPESNEAAYRFLEWVLRP